MPNNRLLARLMLGAAVASLLAGCATSETQVQTSEALRRAEELNRTAAHPMAPADLSPVRVKSDVYMGASVHRNDHGLPLPARFQTERVTFAKAKLVTFQEVAHDITSGTRIPVAVVGAAKPPAAQQGQQPQAAQQGPQVLAGGDSTGRGTQQASAGGGGLRPQAAIPLPAGVDPGLAAAAIIASGGGGGQAPGAVAGMTLPDSVTGELGVPGKMRLDYAGPLAGFLDLVGANFNLAWEYRGERIVFSREVTKTFEVPALAIITDMSFSMSSGTSAGGSSGSGGASSSGTGDQQATTKTAYKITEGIRSTLKVIVTDGVYEFNESSGQVTVVAPPQTVTRVADYIRDLNANLSKQVALNVKVYSVTINDGDVYSSNVAGLFTKAGQYGLSFGNGGTITPGANGVPNASSNTANGANGAGSVGWAILNSKSPFAGTNGVFQALASRGDVSVVTSASMIAMNGVPVPLQVANTRGYAAQVTVTPATVAGGSPSTSITPGSVTTGFNLHMLPKIRQDGSVLLQYGMNISELVGDTKGFDIFSSNGTEVQLPNVNQRNFIQEAVLPNSSTLVLTGFEQVSSSSTKSGPVSSSLFALGGTNTSTVSRQVLVIAITPTVLDISVEANPPQQQ